MGLYDGASGRGELASTAHVAKLLRAPVVLVLDAAAMARSVAAIVHGYASFDPDVDVAGVILNRVGSEGHAQLLREAIEPLGVPVLGVLRRDDALTAPERHLGLVPVAERETRARETLERLGAAVEASCDLDALLRAGARRADEPGAAWRPDPGADPLLARIAVARGPAFSFHYEENLELLRAAGAELVDLDPLADEALPPRTGALVLAGGFPEVFGEELSANWALRAEIAAFAARGRPILAECGGLLYLARRLDGRPMCDVVPIAGHMTAGSSLGYREATAAADHAAWPTGTKVRGHEFHYSRVEPSADPGARRGRCAPAVSSARRATSSARVHACYLHTHWAATPGVAARLVAAAAAGMRRPLPRRSHDRRTLIGVGVGPGRPRAPHAQGAAHAAGGRSRLRPRHQRAPGVAGRAEVIVAEHVPAGRIERVHFAMGDDGARARNWNAAGEAIAAVVRAGGSAAFATIGDPNLYSTFTYVAHTVRGLVPGVEVRTVPGITAMQDLAARSGTVLAEGAEPLDPVPLHGRRRPPARRAGQRRHRRRLQGRAPSARGARCRARCGPPRPQRLRRATRARGRGDRPGRRAHGQRAVHVDGHRAGAAQRPPRREAVTAAAHGAEVGPVETAVHRLAPQCKVAALLAFVVAVALVPYRHAWPYAIDAALLAAVVVASRTPPSLLARRLVVEIPFVAFVLVLPFVAQGPQVDVLGIGVARDGLWAAGGIAAKATLAVLATGVLAADDPRARDRRRPRAHARATPAHRDRRLRAALPAARARRAGAAAQRAHRPRRRPALAVAGAHRGALRAERWPCAACSAASASTPRCSPAATTGACRPRASRRRPARSRGPRRSRCRRSQWRRRSPCGGSRDRSAHDRG